LTVELGLQSIHEKTAKFINRCHTLEEFELGVKKLRDRNIDVVVHIINGLPNETIDMMLETAKYLNTLDIQGVKIHMLHIVKNTNLAKVYQVSPFKILSKDEYIDIVVKQLELLNDKIVIHRLTGDPDPNDLIEPTWTIKKIDVLNGIDKLMAQKNTYQGIKS
jgi:radical SAM protein (TIGR01212 family)